MRHDSKKLTDLERDVLKLFAHHSDFSISPNFVSDLESIECERKLTGVGFLTEFQKNIIPLKATSLQSSAIWDRLSAVLNNETLVGFLVYVEDGNVSAIEGFTYGEKWPRELNNVKFEIASEPKVNS